MPLTTGARFGGYEIVGALGAGGMGEVYRARDTRLGREVAIKILPSAFTGDADRLARFEREARMLASLNHPNIAAIHGIEEADGIRGLVLELVEGETLADRIKYVGSGIGINAALAIARQIADALDAAHEKGIIHRDLKPANIKITPEGVVKVLDFGLAKPALDGSNAGLSHSPTETLGGAILGTAAYMSPEQARGKSVDKRTDIWAFGCVLYEMLTGTSAFARETVSDTIAAILEREPDWTILPAASQIPGRRLIERCLEKDPRRRLRDIGDLRTEIDDAIAGRTRFEPAPAGTRVARRLVGIALGAALATIALTSLWLLLPVRIAERQGVEFRRVTDLVGLEESAAISPDGKTVAFVASAGGRRQIWVRLLAGGTPLQITSDHADHQNPRWSPDSSAIIYYSPSDVPGEEGTIWEISALGGPGRRLVAAIGSGDISHDGRRIAVFHLNAGRTELSAVVRDGSGTERLHEMPGESIYQHPRWSPDDQWIAYQTIDSFEFDKRVYIVPSNGGEPQLVARADDLRGLAWLPDGSGLVYASSAGSTVLYPPTFNLRKVARDGSGDQQLTFGDVSYEEPDVHATGALVATGVRSASDVWRFPVTGSPADNVRGGVKITAQTSAAQTPSVSPDDKELVYLSDSGGHGNLWVANTNGSGRRQITFEGDPSVSVGVPVWSSTSGQIAFILTRSGAAGQWLINRDGSGLRQFVPSGTWAFWSRDDRWLYYIVNRQSGRCIEKAPLDGGAAVPVRCDNVAAPSLSPDGQTLYYAVPLKRVGAGLDWEIRRARPESGASEVLARVAGSRVPVDYMNIHLIPSPDGQWLALPLSDGATSNLWALPADGGPMRPLTDFGDRPIVIARRISWSGDGKYIYAAVAEIDADVVLLDRLLQ